MRPLFLFYGRSAVQTGCNTKKKGCRLTEWERNYGSRYGLMECSTEAHGA